jgi:hypothetical protein
LVSTRLDLGLSYEPIQDNHLGYHIHRRRRLEVSFDAAIA